MALDYGGKIYQQSDAAPVGEAYALALAANGKWDDAVKTQQAAMFVLVRNGRKQRAAGLPRFPAAVPGAQDAGSPVGAR